MALIDNDGNQLGLIDLGLWCVTVSAVGMRCSESCSAAADLCCDSSHVGHWAYAACMLMWDHGERSNEKLVGEGIWRDRIARRAYSPFA